MLGISRTFDGFPREAFDFLSGLSKSNNKNWFDTHRSVYDAAVLKPALSFVQVMGGALQAMAPSVKPEPRVGGSVFRINRDIRFSADKSPYKTHVGIRFRDRDTIVSPKCTGPLFYVEFDAHFLRLGVGVKEFDSRTLSAFRQSVANGGSRKAAAAVLGEAQRRAEESGATILGALSARPPRGFEVRRHPDLLRRRGFFVRTEVALPDAIYGPQFVEYCADWFGPYIPVFDSLREVAVAAHGP